MSENGLYNSSLLELLYRLINNNPMSWKNVLMWKNFVRDIYARHGSKKMILSAASNRLTAWYNQNKDKVVYEYDYLNIQENHKPKGKGNIERIVLHDSGKLFSICVKHKWLLPAGMWFISIKNWIDRLIILVNFSVPQEWCIPITNSSESLK